MKKTLVIGASENPGRYASIAIEHLKQFGHPVVALGKSAGKIHGVAIEVGTPEVAEVDTVAIYVGPAHQSPLEEYITSLKPRRVIFPPGTENPAFQKQLEQKGIEAVEGCTMVMLATGQF